MVLNFLQKLGLPLNSGSFSVFERFFSLHIDRAQHFSRKSDCGTPMETAIS